MDVLLAGAAHMQQVELQNKRRRRDDHDEARVQALLETVRMVLTEEGQEEDVNAGPASALRVQQQRASLEAHDREQQRALLEAAGPSADRGAAALDPTGITLPTALLLELQQLQQAGAQQLLLLPEHLLLQHLSAETLLALEAQHAAQLLAQLPEAQLQRDVQQQLSHPAGGHGRHGGGHPRAASSGSHDTHYEEEGAEREAGDDTEHMPGNRGGEAGTSTEGRKRAPANSKAGIPGGPCAHCGATESPQWRRPLARKVVLCNACGIYYSRHHSLPKRKKASAANAKARAAKQTPARATPPQPGSQQGGSEEWGEGRRDDTLLRCEEELGGDLGPVAEEVTERLSTAERPRRQGTPPRAAMGEPAPSAQTSHGSLGAGDEGPAPVLQAPALSAMAGGPAAPTGRERRGGLAGAEVLHSAAPTPPDSRVASAVSEGAGQGTSSQSLAATAELLLQVQRSGLCVPGVSGDVARAYAAQLADVSSSTLEGQQGPVPHATLSLPLGRQWPLRGGISAVVNTFLTHPEAMQLASLMQPSGSRSGPSS